MQLDIPDSEKVKLGEFFPSRFRMSYWQSPKQLIDGSDLQMDS